MIFSTLLFKHSEDINNNITVYNIKILPFVSLNKSVNRIMELNCLSPLKKYMSMASVVIYKILELGDEVNILHKQRHSSFRK